MSEIVCQGLIEHKSKVLLPSIIYYTDCEHTAKYRIYYDRYHNQQDYEKDMITVNVCEYHLDKCRSFLNGLGIPYTIEEIN